MILVYITCRDREEAKKISRHLLEKRLVACTNVFPIKSFYRWKNKISENSEIVMIAKSLEENFEKIRREIGKIHSYDIPCILKIKVKGNKEFLGWIKEEVESRKSK
jgi:periplasmic divalent cation tolerance protein